MAVTRELTTAWQDFKDTGRQVALQLLPTAAGMADLATLTGWFGDLAARAKETFGAVSDAVGAGDWVLAWKIGLAALKAEWENFAFYFRVGWNVVQEVFVDGWKDAVAGLKVLFIDLGAFIVRNTAGTARQLLEQLAGAVSKVSKKLGQELRTAAAALPSDEQTNAARDAQRGQVMDERAREQAEANAARAAEQARRDARAELAQLRDLARWRAEFNAMPWLGEDEEDGGGPAGRFSGPARLADVVKSGFGNAAISQSLGIGDTIPQQQLDATRGVMANTSQIPQLARDMNQLARGGRLGP